jgi:hypothetical protein
MTARTSGSAPASESVGSEVMDGAGIIGDAIGMNEAYFTTTTGTTLGVTHSITGTTSTGIEPNAVSIRSTVIERMTTPTKGAGLPTGTSVGAAKFITIPAQQPGLSVEIPGLLEDTLNPVGRAAFARGPSAVMTVADKKKAFRHAEAPASAAAERFTGAVAVIGNRSSLRSW